ncbi:MAG TPA: HAMP domain-containing sensor histidine kinase [Gemmatimonadaceae bacterium]|nr:HAMP domain-containing sensor histidine kinase [Gemmatimonadaceae bacterium]
MWSTRARLAAAYAGLLFVTLVAFCAAVFVARRASAFQELAAFGQQAERAADEVLRVMASAEVSGKRLTLRDSTLVVRDRGDQVDGVDSVWTTLVSPLPDLRNVLETWPGYFLVLDERSRLLYSSDAMRRLSTDEQNVINQQAVTLYQSGRAAVVPFARGNRILLVARSDSALTPNISRVVAGVPAYDPEVPARLLLGSMFLLAPLMLLLSVAVAYILAGSTFKPVDQLINEVEAITDGRSLHRRVPTDEADEELGRLAETLNRMISRLQTSFGALRRFTADASHELKTPLTVVRADVERAMHPGAANEERMEALEEAMQEIARMSDLVDSLLTLARADEGRFDLHREPLNLEPLVRDVFETALILGESAGVTVSLPLVEDAVVQGDSTRLRQLFLNLITNAIKYTPRGGHVEMTLSYRNNNEVGFTVRDTGVGIAAADLPHIFDRFWRADKVRSRRGPDGTVATERGGFGLGLAIAQWIAQAHGGSLTAQSRLGRGSIFTVLLPVAAPPASQS